MDANNWEWCKAIEKMLDELKWEPVEWKHEDILDDIPVVTHTGLFEFEGISLRVYQLSNGKRVIDAEDLENLWSE